MKEETKLRVKYNETDSMKYLYHANYINYYHVSRTELLRKVGLCDKILDLNGIILPVIEMHSKFVKPAFYDDELIVKTLLQKVSACKLFFCHEIFNEMNEKINSGSTIVAYVNKATGKPIKIPTEINEKLNYLINKN